MFLLCVFQNLNKRTPVISLPSCALIGSPVFTTLCSCLPVQMNIFAPLYYTQRIQVFSPGGDLDVSSNLPILQYFANECVRL